MSTLSQTCSESNLFEGVIEWAQHRGSSVEAADELAELLPFIRFPVMLPEELQVLHLLPIPLSAALTSTAVHPAGAA